MSHEIHDEKDLSDIERALKSLRPAPSRIERDRLMFRAGQLSMSETRAVAPAEWRRWRWPTAAAAAALVAVTLSVYWAVRLGMREEAERNLATTPRHNAPLVVENDLQTVNDAMELASPGVLPGPVGFGQYMLPAVAVAPGRSNRNWNVAPVRRASQRQPVFVCRPGGDTTMVIIVVPNLEIVPDQQPVQPNRSSF